MALEQVGHIGGMLVPSNVGVVLLTAIKKIMVRIVILKILIFFSLLVSNWNWKISIRGIPKNPEQPEIQEGEKR